MDSTLRLMVSTVSWSLNGASASKPALSEYERSSGHSQTIRSSIGSGLHRAETYKKGITPRCRSHQHLHTLHSISQYLLLYSVSLFDLSSQCISLPGHRSHSPFSPFPPLPSPSSKLARMVVPPMLPQRAARLQQRSRCTVNTHVSHQTL